MDDFYLVTIQHQNRQIKITCLLSPTNDARRSREVALKPSNCSKSIKSSAGLRSAPRQAVFETAENEPFSCVKSLEHHPLPRALDNFGTRCLVAMEPNAHTTDLVARARSDD